LEFPGNHLLENCWVRRWASDCRRHWLALAWPCGPVRAWSGPTMSPRRCKRWEWPKRFSPEAD